MGTARLTRITRGHSVNEFILLVSLSNPRAGQAFIDYMAYRGIRVSMQKEEETFTLYLHDQKDLVEAQAELKAFLQNPTSEKYLSASWSMAETRTAKFRYPKQAFFANLLKQGGPVTFLILIACLAVFAELQLGDKEQIFTWLHFPADSEQYQQWWRIFTPAFMHFSATHIVFNLLWWWVLGGQIEKRVGSLKLLAIFVLSAWGSGFAQAWFEGINFGGLSGVVYALMGYLFVMKSLAPSKRLDIDNTYVGFMLVWMMLGFIEPFGMAIANLAHLFGLIFGALIGFTDAKLTKPSSTPPTNQQQ